MGYVACLGIGPHGNYFVLRYYRDSTLKSEISPTLWARHHGNYISDRLAVSIYQPYFSNPLSIFSKRPCLDQLWRNLSSMLYLVPSDVCKDVILQLCPRNRCHDRSANKMILHSTPISGWLSAERRSGTLKRDVCELRALPHCGIRAGGHQHTNSNADNILGDLMVCHGV